MTNAESSSLLKEFKNMMVSFREEIATMIKKDRKELIEALKGIGLLDPEEELWSKKDVMSKYDVSRGCIEAMMKNGTLPYIKKGTSKSSPVRFRPADVRIALLDK